MRAVVDLIPNYVTEEMNNDLMASYSGEEIDSWCFVPNAS